MSKRSQGGTYELPDQANDVGLRRGRGRGRSSANACRKTRCPSQLGQLTISASVAGRTWIGLDMLGWTLKREEGVRVRQRRWLSASQAGRSCQYVSCHGPLILLAPPKSSWPSHLPLVSQSPADSLVALVSAVYVLQSRPSSEGSPTRRPATWTRPPVRHRVKDGTRLRKQTPLSTRAGLIAPF